MEIKGVIWNSCSWKLGEGYVILVAGGDVMDELLAKIKEATCSEIDALLNAAIERKRELFPDWETVYLAMPKRDTRQWKQILDQVYAYMVLGKDS